MNNMDVYYKSITSTESYEPFMVGDKQAREVHWLTQATSSGDVAYSGLWRCESITFEYEFPGDEVFRVLKGELRIEILGGDVINVTEGDIISINKGIKSTWTIQRSFKFFCYL